MRMTSKLKSSIAPVGEFSLVLGERDTRWANLPIFTTPRSTPRETSMSARWAWASGSRSLRLWEVNKGIDHIDELEGLISLGLEYSFLDELETKVYRDRNS